ncbi:integrase [Arthrobacter sp. Soil761]|nr:integrase [Arthrobacter sp. Soil761]
MVGSLGVRVLPSNVVPLDPMQAAFEGMLAGWERQRLSRGLNPTATRSNIALVKRFAHFTGEYPWQWQPADVEDFTVSLINRPEPAAHSTLRGYHGMIRTFCSYITDPRYEWPEVCQERFGSYPVQICHDWNTRHHVAEFEGRPAKRALTFDEAEAFFRHADEKVERIIAAGKKGALSALRDAQFFKTVYAFGLRRREACMLDLADLRSNPNNPDWGSYGSVHVRFAKANKGGPSRRRTVLAVPEFAWAVDGLRQWVEAARPRFRPGDLNPVWVTERRSRMSVRHVDEKFALLRDEIGLDPHLTLHSLRHSYVTHLVEYGYPERFVSEQVGHSYASSTAIYTDVSDDYKNRILSKALARIRQPEQQGPQQ